MDEYDDVEDNNLVTVPLNKSLITASSFQNPFTTRPKATDKRMEEIEKANRKMQRDRVFEEVSDKQKEDEKYFHPEEV